MNHVESRRRKVQKGESSLWFSLLALRPTIGTLPLSSVFFPRWTWGIYGDSTSMIGSKSFSSFLGQNMGPSIFCTIFAGETRHFMDLLRSGICC